MEKRMGRLVAVSAVVIAIAGADTLARGQKLTPQDLAARLSGTWKLNRELSTGFRPAGRRSGGALAPRSFAVAGAFVQRRGGGGAGGGGFNDPSDLTPEQRAEQAAMRQLQQTASTIQIKASADSVTFIDARGERTFEINNKTTKLDFSGVPVSARSKWDKNTLKQEFSNTQAKLVQTWGLDDAGHLVLMAKIESMTLRTPDQKAVFDRQ
jgi:hypothetical protein